MTREELLQSAKPILFNTEMVRAILDGRKTVTRRCVKPQPPTYARIIKRATDMFMWQVDMHDMDIKTPYKQGDVLYVRETFVQPASHIFWYKADDNSWLDGKNMRWKPSIHMPKEAARIFLNVTDVRVERLQDITWQQAAREGCYGSTSDEPDQLFHIPTLRGEFQKLWNSTIKKSDLATYGWDANPWVWVIEFERIEV